MSILEFLDEFNVLYNNINSNQAPGLNEYQISVFLTKAQDELLKNLFVGESAGNPNKIGFDGNEKRHIDFSNLMTVVYPRAVNDAIVHKLDNRSYLYELPSDILFIVNEVYYKSLNSNIFSKVSDKLGSGTSTQPKPEFVSTFSLQENTYKVVNISGEETDKTNTIVTNPAYSGVITCNSESAGSNKAALSNIEVLLSNNKNSARFIENALQIEGYNFGRVSQCQIVPVTYDSYNQLLSSPYKSPIRNQVWRLISDNSSTDILKNKKYAEVIIGNGYSPANALLTMNDFTIMKKSNGYIVEDRGDDGPVKFRIQPQGSGSYVVRYVRRPKPIIVFPAEDNTVSIDGVFGYDADSDIQTLVPCELDPILHKEIVQRAVELAKVAWAGQDPNKDQTTLLVGNRME